MSEPAAADTVPKPLDATGNSVVLHSVLQQLDASQWWPLEQMRRGQLQQLRKLLHHARNHSPFYGQRLQHLDVDRFTLAQLAELPVLTRSQLQDENAAIDAQVLPPDHGVAKETMTSGSTATPVRIRATGVNALLWNALNMREHLWHGRDTRQVACAIRWRGDGIGMSSDGVTLPDWGAPVNQFFHTAPSYYLNSAMDIAVQARWLAHRQPAYLMSHPSNIVALAEQQRHAAGLLSRLREIRTVGEMVTAELRALVQEVFAVPVTDCYTSQELGYIALQCPQHLHYHVQAESVLVEVLREDGSTCAPYETGRLVITSLRNYATPLVRYDIGDYGALGEACPCGRGLPVLHSISGRVRNMLVLPDGNRRWPNFGFGKMMKIAELRQFQVVQTGPVDIELKLVTDAPLSSHQELGLQSILRESLGYPFHITISYHGALARSAGGKFEDFISLVSAG